MIAPEFLYPAGGVTNPDVAALVDAVRNGEVGSCFHCTGLKAGFGFTLFGREGVHVTENGQPARCRGNHARDRKRAHA